MRSGERLTGDARRIVAVQAARALAYGLGSVVIGAGLARRGLSGPQVGVVLAALLTGAAVVSVLLARYGDRVGRRRAYRLLLAAMAVAGTVFALTSWLPALLLAALTGTVSTDVVESGPFTSLEQAMLPHAAANATRVFGTYNTVATLAGWPGALIALAGSSARPLLAAIAFAPDRTVAVALLLARFALSQMDVPTRQAYVVALVDPSERTAAAAYTNTARYLTRPVAPIAAGAALRISLGAPFLLAGALKSLYDVGLYLQFRGAPLQ